MAKQYHKNPRQITAKQYEALAIDLAELGDLGGIVHDLNSDEVIGGNQRSRVFDLNACDVVLTEVLDQPDEQGTIAHGYVIWKGHKYAYRQVRWTPRQCERANIAANARGGRWDFDILADQFNQDDLLAWGFEPFELGIDETDKPTTGDTEAQTDRAEELRQLWNVQPGQMWQLGEHRLICGDCTDAATVARVMGGEKAALVHADPPYGMGKEKDGIANDNLYREKLDAFQMAWWRACRSSLDDNGSVYIWGNADDLWRLWYCGGLRDSERLTLRNEIVWQKQGAQGIRSEAHRQYPTASERCLFFMLGEQGFSNNADNYWDGFTPIVEYLEAQRKAAGWSIKDTKRIAGHSENSGCHWFDKSQWTMPTQEVYDAWRDAAHGNAFRREYDDLRREWYSTRAHFDNTHDNMTDVWQFGRVTGDERHDHATPKPTEMIARVVKSSAPGGAIVYTPFGGTLPEIIACENLSRRCRAVEISAAYCAVALQRWADHTQRTPVLLEAVGNS